MLRLRETAPLKHTQTNRGGKDVTVQKSEEPKQKGVKMTAVDDVF